jgi:hypothetical protein
MGKIIKLTKSISASTKKIKSIAKYIKQHKKRSRTRSRIRSRFGIRSRSRTKSRFGIRPRSRTRTRKIINPNKNYSYYIAIPTYQRPDIIQKKTLALLHNHNINPKIINLFVANNEEATKYKKLVPRHLYGNIIVGEKGLKNQRNFISRYYKAGKYIVEFDDDINKIVELVVLDNGKKDIRPITNLDTFIKNAFTICHKKNIYLWGVYPIANAHFMTDTITTDLRFIVGPMWGMINRHRNDLQLTIDEKENSERTLQYWTADSAVLRFNNVAIETTYYKNKGGMQAEGKNRKEEAMKSAIYLHNKYPNITKIYLGKKSGVPEVKLLRIK